MVELSTPVKSWISKETIAIEGLQVQFLSVSFFLFFVCRDFIRIATAKTATGFVSVKCDVYLLTLKSLQSAVFFSLLHPHSRVSLVYILLAKLNLIFCFLFSKKRYEFHKL